MIAFFKGHIYTRIIVLLFCLWLLFPSTLVLAVDDSDGMLAPADGGGIITDPAGRSGDGDGMLAPANTGGVNSETRTSGSNPEASTGGRNTSSGSSELKNPLKSQSIEEFLLKIIDVLLVFALPIIVLYIMYAGYLFVTAQGDAGQVSEARSALLWAVVGGVIILGAKVIITVIQGTITAF